MALRSNTKKAKENLKKYITEYSANYLVDNYGYSEEEVTKDLYRLISEVFNEEMLTHNTRWKRGLMTAHEVFEEWASGLAMGGLFCYYYNRSAVDDLGAILEETDEEKRKYSEAEAEKMLTWLIYREVMA